MNEDNAPKTLANRWIKPILLVSLALNLLVAGVIFGHTVSPDSRRYHDFDGDARGVIGEPFVRALQAKDRRALIADIVKDRPRIRENRDSLRQRFDAFLTALRADPYDSETVAQLLLEQREAAVGRQEIGEALLLKRLEDMTATDRAAYADRLEESLRKFKRR